MKTELTISKKTFTNDAGEVLEYNCFEITLGGKTFQLLPRKDDKKLLNYLIDNMKDKT